MNNYNRDKRISSFKLNKTLRKMPNISRKEREYLNKTLKNELKGGLTLFELKKEGKKLQYNPKDIITPRDARSVRQKLLEKFKK